MSLPHHHLSRRSALRTLAGMTGTALGAPMINLGRFRLFAHSQEKYSRRAIELVERAVVIDMLGPFSLNFAELREWMSHPELFTEERFRRYLKSGIDVFHIAVGIGGRDAFASVLQFVGAWNGFIADHADRLLRVDSVGDLAKVNRSGKVGILLGLQNSDHFRTVDDVNVFHGLGQRVSQLTYNSRNMIGNGSTERTDGGVSDFGASIIERMNDVGMAVDVSHSGDQTTLDAMALSRQPVLITHSNCRALNPGHPRCKTDEAIEKMARGGGVMGITGVRNFVRGTEPTTIEHYLDHFDHVRKLVGVEHLGIGSDIDLDGYDDMPEEQYKRLRAGYKGSYAFRDKLDIEGIDHPQRMFDVTDGLIRRGYSDRDIEGILGGNFQRVLGQIWAA